MLRLTQNPALTAAMRYYGALSQLDFSGIRTYEAPSDSKKSIPLQYLRQPD
jgi:hypothetical protein